MDTGRDFPDILLLVKNGGDENRGLSLAELLVAMALLSITLVSLVSVLVSGLRADRKAFYLEAATSLADRELKRSLHSLRTGTPPEARVDFWETDYPYPSATWRQGQETISRNHYNYYLYAVSVTDTGGSPIGEPDNRLKRIDVYVRWGEQRGHKTGHGKTMFHKRSLFSEASQE